MRIAFRTDASSSLGLGHLRRCISLAQALSRLGAQVRFAARASDVDINALLAGAALHGTLVEPIPAGDSDDFAADARASIARFNSFQPDWVVVDHYALDAGWHTLVREALRCRIAVIDDLADRPIAADALIDHNFVPSPGHKSKYHDVIGESSPRWLCGPRFALLGPAYQGLPPFKTSDQVRSIGVFLGGTDPAQLSVAALAACRSVACFHGSIEIVSTRSNAGLAVLEDVVRDDPKTSLSLDLPDLAAFYARHDLHIGAGGGSTWERCAVGAPTLTLCVAANQLAVIPALEAIGVVASCPDNAPATIGKSLHALIESRATREAMSQRSQALVDGLGADRVALALAAQLADAITVRTVQLSDTQTLWQWRNHPQTRSVSRNQAEIPLADHQAWLRKTLSEPTSVMLLAHCGTRQIGVIRFDLRQPTSAYEVSLHLDPELLGLSLGTALLRTGEQALAAKVGPVALHAEVLPSNSASRQLFVAAGFTADSPTTYFKPPPAACALSRGYAVDAHPGQLTAVSQQESHS